VLHHHRICAQTLSSSLPRSNTMFSKTKMCKFYIMGKCTRGKECQWAHDASDLRGTPDLHCTKMCKELLSKGRCLQPACTYAHGALELRTTRSKKKAPCGPGQDGFPAGVPEVSFESLTISPPPGLEDFGGEGYVPMNVDAVAAWAWAMPRWEDSESASTCRIDESEPNDSDDEPRISPETSILDILAASWSSGSTPAKMPTRKLGSSNFSSTSTTCSSLPDFQF